MREVLELLALAFVRHDPGIDRDVGDRIVPGDEGAIGQAPVQHAIEPVHLVTVAVHRILQLFHRVIVEVIVLAGHRPEVAHLPEQPLGGLGARAQVARQELAGLLREIEQHGAGLEHGNRLAAASRRMINQGRDTVVRRHREKVGFELLALADIHRLDVVGDPGLLEEDRDLMAVGRGPIVEVDHGHGPLHCDQSNAAGG
jgi:hypothetical protein